MPNLWRQFALLLPQSPVLLGTVATVFNDGTASVVLLGGGVQRAASGSVACAEGDRVFLRDGQIEGVAPALPLVLIDI